MKHQDVPRTSQGSSLKHRIDLTVPYRLSLQHSDAAPMKVSHTHPLVKGAD